MKNDALLLRGAVKPLDGSSRDFDPIMAAARGKRIVLLGEASHGTHEFYRIRGEITKRLIREEGFDAVAVEADWPDAHRINRYVRGSGHDSEAVEALGGFLRFPQWMWRNSDVLDFIGWLRNQNEGDSDRRMAGFYGLDLYSMNSSREAVITYLRDRDPLAAKRVTENYSCFDHFGNDTRRYGLLTGSGISGNCEREVIEALLQIHRHRRELLARDGTKAAEEYFDAEQNARLVRDAEEYYRTMYLGDVSSWNLRDTHMMQALLLLTDHLKTLKGTAKVVVWAHNSHLGNAAATAMGARGEINIGQLVREYFGKAALSIGFTTHSGTVTAASDWDGPAERKRVRPGLPGSYEELFHRTGIPSFWLDCNRERNVRSLLLEPRLERAIGVIYRPDTERASHYFPASLAEQFDGILHFDVTRAVEPLERSVEWIAGEVDETYPSGI